MSNRSRVGVREASIKGQEADLGGREAAREDCIDPDRVRSVLGRMPSDTALHDAADVFSLLGEPHRLRLMLALLDGELCVHDLASITGQSDSSTSHALKLLRAHRVVSTRRSGRRVFYALDDPHVRILLDLVVAHTEHAVPVRDGGDHPTSPVEDGSRGPGRPRGAGGPS